MQDPLIRSAVEAAGAAGPSAVTLAVPAQPFYSAVVKAVSGHLGARTGLTVTEITDLRLAVDEVFGLLLPQPMPNQEVCCLFIHEETVLRISFCVLDTGQDTPDIGGFGWLVLAALVDGLDWSRATGRVRVDVVKQSLQRDVL